MILFPTNTIPIAAVTFTVYTDCVRHGAPSLATADDITRVPLFTPRCLYFPHPSRFGVGGMGGPPHLRICLHVS